MVCFCVLNFPYHLLIQLQLIRIRSKDGNFRFDFNPDDDISRLLEKVCLLQLFTDVCY